MSKATTSIRGERIDFDLLKIKNTMAAVPINENVQKRERFINKKRRRGLKRKVGEMAQTKRLEDANFESALELTKAAKPEEQTEQLPQKKARRKVR